RLLGFRWWLDGGRKRWRLWRRGGRRGHLGLVQRDGDRACLRRDAGAVGDDHELRVRDRDDDLDGTVEGPFGPRGHVAPVETLRGATTMHIDADIAAHHHPNTARFGHDEREVGEATQARRRGRGEELAQWVV